MMASFLVAGCVVPATRIPLGSAIPAAPSRVVVNVRGGTCRPEPVVGWFATDGRELVSVGVPADGATLPPPDSTAHPAYLLADCRSYYLAGSRWAGEPDPSYRITLDRAVPPRQMGHGNRVRVLVQDGGSGEPVPGARVFWVGRDERDAPAREADAQGIAWLPAPTPSALPRFLLADASDRGYQITGQHYRLYFDQYVIVLRRADGHGSATP
jgi:hypothetical protein